MATPVATPGAAARAVLDRHRTLGTAAAAVLAHVDGLRAQVVRLDAESREARVLVELAGIDVSRLAELTDRNLRLGLLVDAGYRTAADLRGARATTLDAIPGVGRQTARGAIAAVDQLAAAIGATKYLRIEIDPITRTASPETTRLLALLHALLRLGPRVEPHRTELSDYSRSVARALPTARITAHRIQLALVGRRRRAAGFAALARLEKWEPWLLSTGLPATVNELAAACRVPDPVPRELWDDAERRLAAYYATLEELVPAGADPVAIQGMLTAELADRVGAWPLDQALLRVNLRGYQEFGARFVLSQGRVLLGDEMGLGKTVQAIAAMADRAAAGDRHFLVVCPASVLANWAREIATHSALVPHRLHGTDRAAAAARWLADGGVGVTTYEGLEHVPPPGTLPGRPPDAGQQDRPVSDGAVQDRPVSDGAVQDVVPNPSGLGMLVVDEAHFVKNPDAQRSQLVARWAADTFRVVLMSGTPMENRLDEFLALVRMLQPSVAAGVPRHLGLAGSDVFRQVVAPVYLRRNQADVLVELPDVVVVDEWEEQSPAEAVIYREAVASGNFMAMRRAAYVTPDPLDSAKVQRLLEIVEDAAENGHRVVVFSYFRDVIDVVMRALGSVALARAFGPLTGDVPPADRQGLIDAFSAATAGAVLVAQVQVGGVGLNIQAASVVVLCEPQLKPTTEAQAIGRVHRMGQLHTVRVHRLLTEGAVDERICDLLDEKRRVFDQYVRDSSLADHAVRAVDVTEARLAKDVVAFEQARLGYGPVWTQLEAEGLL